MMRGFMVLVTLLVLWVAAWMPDEQADQLTDRVQAAYALVTRDIIKEPVHHITFNPGGSLVDHIAEYSRLRKWHSLVVVDGACVSACTLVINAVDPERICATDRGYFAFHSAADKDVKGQYVFNRNFTEIFWWQTSEAARKLLTERGMDPTKAHPELIFVTGKDVFRLVRHCTDEEMRRL